MSFSVGELVAKLRMDSKEFDAGVQKAQAGLKNVEAAAAKADRAVGTSQKSIHAYANAQRVSTREVLSATRAYDAQMKSASGVSSTMTAARQRMILADQKWERQQGLMHMQALRMNAAFDAQAKVTGRGALNMTHFSNQLRAVAVQMTGLNPIAGRLLSTVGSFALGTGVMIGVFAGLAGLAALWRKLGEDGRIAKEKLQAAQDVAAQVGVSSLPGSIVTQESASVLRARRDAIGRELQEDAQLARRRGLADAPDVLAKETRLRSELANILRDIARLNDHAARQATAEATAREKASVAINRERTFLEKFTEALREYNREEQKRLLAAAHSITAFRDMGNAGGPSAAGVAAFRERQAARRGPIDWDLVGRPLKRLTSDVTTTTDRFKGLRKGLDSFGAGIEASAKGLFDIGALGAQMGGQLIGKWIGGLTSGFEKVTITLKEGVIATNANTAAYREFLDSMNAADVRRLIFTGEEVLARARIAAGDMDSAAQFDVLRDFLAAQLPRSGLFGTGGMGSSVGRLSLDNIDEFVQSIIAQIDSGALTADDLGGIGLPEFLNILLELESLGDSAGDAASELAGMASTLRNAPSGFKANFLRYQADSGIDVGGGHDMSGDIVIEEMVVIANDPEEFGRKMKQHRRRGGTTNLQLATSPGGAFVKGGV